jgi:hypothetical protein
MAPEPADRPPAHPLVMQALHGAFRGEAADEEGERRDAAGDEERKGRSRRVMAAMMMRGSTIWDQVEEEHVLRALARACATVSAHLGVQALRTMRDQLQQIKEAAGRRPARPPHALCPSDSRRQHCRLRTAPACQI